MHTVEQAVRRRGGVARTSQLKKAGLTDAAVRSAVARGEVIRVRKGWLCTPDANPDIVRAVSLGGRLACISAAAHLGLWTPETEHLHVSRPAHAGRAHGDPHGVIVHWQSVAWSAADSAVEAVPALVRQLLLCCTREDAITVIDSALNKRMLDLATLAAVVESLPSRYRTVLSEVDARSESGLESLCRYRLRGLGTSIRSQVTIAGVGRVDLVIGDRLVLEADGRRWHDGSASFLADRTRDLALMRLGYIVLRVGYAHVLNEWALVELTVRALVERGEHLWSAVHRAGGLTRTEDDTPHRA